MFKNALKTAFRRHLRQKTILAINISGLALGMAIAILIFLWVQNEKGYDTFHENGKNLYRVAFTTEDRSFHGSYMPKPLHEYLRDEYPEITHAVYLENIDAKIAMNQNSITSAGYFVQDDFFEMFTFPFLAGNPETAFDNIACIVITESLAQKLFGKQDPLGQFVKIEDQVELEVTGVVQDPPDNSSLKFDYLLSTLISPDPMGSWEWKSVETFVQLQDGVSAASVDNKIVNVYNDHNPGANINLYYLQPFTEMHLHNLGGGGRITYVYIFSLMAAFILLIACINFMNLTTARSEIHFREIGIKKVVGSSRGQLIMQYLIESAAMAVLSLFIALLLVEIFLPSINSVFNYKINFELSGTLVLGLLSITLVTGIIAGSFPAFYLSSIKPICMLKGNLNLGSNNKSKGSTVRKILVVFQFALSVFFIICAIEIYNQLNYLKNKDLGFDQEHIVVLRLKGETQNKTALMKQELLDIKGVENISCSYNELDRWGCSTGIDWEGKQTDEIFDVGQNWVDYDFLETFKIDLVEGRFFSPDYKSDGQRKYVINETLVKRMGMENPVGKTITRMPGSSYEETGTIIGVMKDFHTESLHGPIRPFLLMPALKGSNMCIRLDSDNIPGTLGLIKNKVKEIVPNDPFVYHFLDDTFDNLYKSEQQTGQLTIYITIFAIFISCLGLLGLTIFTVERRAKEIGIRKVFGSSVSNIVFLLSRDLVKWIVIANLIAWPFAFIVMQRWLENFNFNIGIQWYVFFMAGIIAMVLSLLTISIQAVRAALANPVDTLKHE